MAERIGPSLSQVEIANRELLLPVTNYAKEAQEKLKSAGLNVIGATYTALPHAREAKLTGGVTLIVVPDKTPRHFHTIDFERRMATVYGEYYLPGVAEAHEVNARYFDLKYYVDPKNPLADDKDPGPPNYGETTTEKVEDLIKSGVLELEGVIAQTSKEYGIEEVAMTNNHIVSPDPFPITIAASAIERGLIKNILEIGGGVSPITQIALGNGVPVTVIDNSSQVLERLDKKYPHKDYPELTLVQNDAGKFLSGASSEERYSLVNAGIPYELNPEFIEKHGALLAEKADLFLLQSGTPGLGEMEHDIAMGKDYVKNFPWYKEEMSVGHHFPHVIETLRLYQFGIIAGFDKAFLDKIVLPLKETGKLFIPPTLCQMNL